MKNKRMISLLLAAAMIIALVPASAFAGATTQVNIGTAKLTASKPYYHNGVGGAQGTADNDPTNANATFDIATGTLTLNNLNIVNDADGYKGIQWSYSSSGANDLIIVLPAGTTNTVVNNKGAAINGEYGWTNQDGGGSLTVTGDGTLNVTGSSYGIWVWYNIIFEDNVTVNVTGTSKAAIANNNKYGKVLIKDNATVNAEGGEYGIGYDNNRVNIPEIQSGKINIKGGTAAFMQHPNPLGAAVNAGTIKVNTDASDVGAADWDKTTEFTNYKYVGITSTAVTTYTATYHSNDGTNAQYQQTFAEGIAQNLKDNRFESSSSTFNGWNTAADGTGTAYADKASVTLAANVDLYAQWDNAGTITPTEYTITFDGQGGTVMPSTPQTTINGKLPAIVPIADRDGYNFKGWYTAAEGGTEITDETVFTSNCTVYAHWEANTPNVPNNPNPNPNPNPGGGNHNHNHNHNSIPEIIIVEAPKTGDVSVVGYAVMAIVAAAGAMGLNK